MKRILVPLLLSLAVSADPAGAQEDLSTLLEERSEGIPEGPRAFQETWLLPGAGSTAREPAATEFGGRVHVYQRSPRERLEIRKVEDGELAGAMVVVFDGSDYMLVTPVGATPFAESDRADDPFVRMVLAGPPGPAPPHRTIAGDGDPAVIVLRHSLSAEFDPEKAFALELPRGGEGLLSGVSRFSAAGDSEVVASAGARGVDQVQTAGGTIHVTPDPEGIEWMEREVAVSTVELERFRLEARLPPYDLLPAEDPDAGEGR